MKLRFALLYLGLASLLPFTLAEDATPATDSERIEMLEQRVDKLEDLLERILLLLQKQQAAANNQLAQKPNPAAKPTQRASTIAADTQVTIAPVSPAANLKPGLLLDVWSRPNNFQGGVPSTPSLLTVLDTRPPIFALNRYAADKELASSVGKPHILAWRGYLQVKQAGAHVLVAEFRRTTDKSVAKSQPWKDHLFSWSAQLSVNDTPLLDETNKFESAGKGTLARNFTLNLQPGFYAVQLVTWLPSQGAEDIYDYSPLAIGLRLREPGAPKPRDLGPMDFVCAQ